MMDYTDGHAMHSSGLLVIGFLLFIVLYGLASLYNFSTLFKKAGKPNWAVIIPFYGPIVAAQIGKQPMWLAILFSLFGLAHFSGPGNAYSYVATVQLIATLCFGIPLLIGMSKQYKASHGFWYILILLPFIASFQIKHVSYSPH